MKKNTVKILFSQVIFLLFVIAAVPFMATDCSAAEQEGQKVQYSMGHTFEENLKLFTGQYVRIILSSGSELSGTIQEVKNGKLHLKKLSGRSFFDALIRVEDISSMDAKFRGF